MGRTDFLELVIDTQSVTPIKQPPRRLPPFKREEVGKQVDERRFVNRGEWNRQLVLGAALLFLPRKSMELTAFVLITGSLTWSLSKTPNHYCGMKTHWNHWVGRNGSLALISPQIKSTSTKTVPWGEEAPKRCTKLKEACRINTLIRELQTLDINQRSTFSFTTLNSKVVEGAK